MKRATQYSVKFNEDKIQYKVKSVRYLGLQFSEAGVRQDERKISAILAMKTLSSKKVLQVFMGMVNYLHSFIPNLSQLTAPCRLLLKKKVSWHWE